MDQRRDPAREQQEQQDRLARLERAVASVERTRQIVDRRLRGPQPGSR